MCDKGEAMFNKAGLITKLVSASVAAAEKSGILVKEILKSGGLKIVEKTGPKDLQTEADRAAQHCIIQSLSKRFGPHLKIIGEEDDESIAEIETNVSVDVLLSGGEESCKDVNIKDVVVWVDPLDGTNEFTEAASKTGLSVLLEQTTVLIGISVNGKPVGGVIHQPFYGVRQGDTDPTKLGRTIWAVNNIVHGMQVVHNNINNNALVTTRSHSTGLVNDVIESLVQAKLADQVLRVGGAGFKVLKLLDGTASAYVFASPGCKKWDTCAPEAILNAAGGVLTDMHGNKLEYDGNVKHMNSAGVLATCPGRDHSKYVNAIPPSLRDKLIP